MGGSSSREMSAAPFVAAAQTRHTATLIFLHGLGDNGQAWCEGFKTLQLKYIKCMCPTAPISPVTLNAGFRMHSWFDIKALDPDGPEDEGGIQKASETLKDMISNEERNGIPPERIILGGFSQGGAVALHTAFTMDKRIAGVVALSTWMPLHKKFPKAMTEINRDIPIFQCHGTIDPLVPPMWGDMTGQLLKKGMTKNHKFTTYPIAHSSCEEEMRDVKSFLEELILEPTQSQKE